MKITVEAVNVKVNEAAIIDALENDNVADLQLPMESPIDEQLLLAMINSLHSLASQFDTTWQGFVDFEARQIEIACGEAVGPEVAQEDCPYVLVEIGPKD